MNYIHLNDEYEDCGDNFKEYTDCVTYYTAGSYDGSGEALFINYSTGRVAGKNLGHCSCYGGFDGGPDWEGTINQLHEVNPSIHAWDFCPEIKQWISRNL